MKDQWKIKFYLYRWQKGEGCDYSIGCGQDFSPMDAQTLQDAEIELQKMIKGDSGDDYNPDRDEKLLEKAAIIPAEAIHWIDLKAFYQKCRDVKKKQKEESNHEAKKKLYEQLKEEFEGKQK